MTEFRQKQGDAAATVPGADFRRGLEELVRDHLDGCMSAALASCSTAHDEEDDDDSASVDGPDQLIRRRRRSDLEGEDLAETSAARRRHSRILSRWVARQAEEMITTIERRNRESELMALAGLHTVSMLVSSFLRDSRRTTPTGGAGEVTDAERPTATRPSSVLQRWRELEGESGGRQPQREVSNGMGNGSSESDEDVSQMSHGLLPAVDREIEEEEEEGPRPGREQSPDLGEGDGERVRQIVRGWTVESGTSEPGSRISSQRNESPRAEWLGETERERVRLVREWVQMASERREARAVRREERDQDRVDYRGGELVADREDSQPENVRREPLGLRGRQARIDLITRIAAERQRELQGLSEHRAVSQFVHRNRIQSLLRGRFLRSGAPAEEGRPPSVAASELGQLRQRHPVSALRPSVIPPTRERKVRPSAVLDVSAYESAESRVTKLPISICPGKLTLIRKDIDRNPREGFHFRSQNAVPDQTGTYSDVSPTHIITSTATDQSQPTVPAGSRTEDSEQSQHRNEGNVMHRVSEVERSMLESSVSQDNIAVQDSTAQGNWQEEISERERSDLPESTEVGISEWQDGAGEESDENWQANLDQNWTRETEANDDGEGSHLPADEWHEDDSREAVHDWDQGTSDYSRSQLSIPIRRVNRFLPPDDDNVYSMELRELHSRRSVSNLLQSSFRDNLDQLIQSHVRRQGPPPVERSLLRSIPTPAVQEGPRDAQRVELDEGQEGPTTRRRVVIPPPPVPPPQPLWHRGLHSSSWARHSIQRLEMEWEIINDLRADMARLQQGMSHMQRMLEACMDMQLELQRSVRQEVSAALNRSLGREGAGDVLTGDGSKWTHARKGMCCICCDGHIDSLLYRCGHMCTCSKCANELVLAGGKCPLCRAPIVEVIRAYSIL